VEERDVIVIGSGPAGIATAAGLARIDPELGASTLVLEKERHPRPKLCGGGVTHRAERALRRLGLEIDVPSVWIERVRFWLDDDPITIDRSRRLRIVRRDEFDAALVSRVRELGVEIREGERVTGLRRDGDRILIETTAGSYRARVLVGADGSKGPVRSAFVPEECSRVSRLMEVLVPDQAGSEEHRDNMAVFDFREIRRNLQGYLWDFPCLVDGQRYLNVGAFDSRRNELPRAPMKELLVERLELRGLDVSKIRLQGAPERWYGPRGKYSAPNVLLVGDAAGAEPLMGEGISFALDFGPFAAAAIAEALRTGDMSFREYDSKLRSGRIGKALVRNQRLARFLYRPGAWALARPLLRLLVRRLEHHGRNHAARAGS